MTGSKDEGSKPTDRPADKSAALGNAVPGSAPAKPGATGSSALGSNATKVDDKAGKAAASPKPDDKSAVPSTSPAKAGPTGSSVTAPSATVTGPKASSSLSSPATSAPKTDAPSISSSSGTPLKPGATGSSAVPPSPVAKDSTTAKAEAPAKAGATGSAAVKPTPVSASPSSAGPSSASPSSPAPGASAKPQTGSDTKADGKSETKTGTASGPQSAGRVGSIGDGPIIDLKAKRIPDPATTASKSASEAEKRSSAGFGAVAASGLVGGAVGAGLLFALMQTGVLSPDASKLDALSQQIATLAPRDALSGLEKRVAASEQAVKPLEEQVRAASGRANEALAKADAAGSQQGGAAPPSDLATRLDALDQRVSALQEEPAREQPANSEQTNGQSGGQRLASLEERLKALEAKDTGEQPQTQPSGPSPEVNEKLNALSGAIEARAKADTALGERLDKVEKSLDQRIGAATQAIEAATQASREAAQAGKTQVEEAAKAIDRRLQEQAQRLGALDKSSSEAAKASTVEAAIRIVAADRITAALASGVPYTDALNSLRSTQGGDEEALAPLQPFAETGAPSAANLAAAFRPIREKILAAQAAARAKSVAETGSFTDRLQSMASSIVQVRRSGEPTAGGQTTPGVDESDPTAAVQTALESGRVGEAAKAFDALSEDVRAQASDFGAKLKARAQADAAAQALASRAFKSLPASAGAP